MAILIEGMEMPKNCAGCFLKVGQCSKRIYMENRPSDCPLIEVPEPHGDLIDRDALMKKLNSCMFPSDMVTTIAISMAMNWLKESPTVIPAEESE